ncbi:hypothetical protein BDN70DRAFT_900237 [Pholiota conissans]|uniref:Uncharacterized protein n=1 Tax=Pholiota conissans TaxID=109636 RepID=A0A9P5YP23_9AGAR|nr:hypothetical protein BDN70DRAFT_900237 [Pholiota conissans]
MPNLNSDNSMKSARDLCGLAQPFEMLLFVWDTIYSIAYSAFHNNRRDGALRHHSASSQFSDLKIQNRIFAARGLIPVEKGGVLKSKNEQEEMLVRRQSAAEKSNTGTNKVSNEIRRNLAAIIYATPDEGQSHSVLIRAHRWEEFRLCTVCGTTIKSLRRLLRNRDAPAEARELADEELDSELSADGARCFGRGTKAAC